MAVTGVALSARVSDLYLLDSKLTGIEFNAGSGLVIVRLEVELGFHGPFVSFPSSEDPAELSVMFHDATELKFRRIVLAADATHQSEHELARVVEQRSWFKQGVRVRFSFWHGQRIEVLAKRYSLDLCSNSPKP